jgi:hypothetical protein
MAEYDDDQFRDWLAGPIDREPTNTALRDFVLRQSVNVLRRRRQAKRLGLVASLTGCFAAGMLTMSLLRPTTSSSNIATATTPQTPDSTGDGKHDIAAPPAKQHETDLVVAKLTPYDRLRQQGDRQLADETDIPGAIRTYKQALQVASDDQRALSVDHDSWLLMALKSDQFRP